MPDWRKGEIGKFTWRNELVQLGRVGRQFKAVSYQLTLPVTKRRRLMRRQ